MLNNPTSVNNSPLGKKSSYSAHYAPELLFPIPRKAKRDELHIPESLPFHGFDTWNAYELSWLNPQGKPVVAVAQVDISCTSKNLVESKSLKLYLNSLNNSHFASMQEVKNVLQHDLHRAVDGEVFIELAELKQLTGQTIEHFSGSCLDNQDISCDIYQVHPSYLTSNPHILVEEVLYSDLLKSNCLVTGQPDWGSVRISYKGAKISPEGLLRYIVSFRNHNEFHEQCVERIFMDIMHYCTPQELTVEARYTRRGGLDINPVRSTQLIKPQTNIRMARQ